MERTPGPALGLPLDLAGLVTGGVVTPRPRNRESVESIGVMSRGK